MECILDKDFQFILVNYHVLDTFYFQLEANNAQRWGVQKKLQTKTALLLLKFAQSRE